MKIDGGSDKNTVIKNEYGRRWRRTEWCLDSRNYLQYYMTLDMYIITGTMCLRLQVADYNQQLEASDTNSQVFHCQINNYWSDSEVPVNFRLQHCSVL